MTAYHTLGQALTETVAHTPSNYGKAKDTFTLAATTPGIHPNTQVTLNLRLAWLEYRRDPSATDEISLPFDAFLQGTSSLTAADKHALQRKILELGRHLGGVYWRRAQDFHA